MKLYHGSPVAVTVPRILTPDPKRTTDFGHGFYVTSDYEQARRWVLLRQKKNQDNGYVSIFDAPDELLNTAGLKILSFTSANREWLDFVMKNRNEVGFRHDYDIVAGPVANDRVYTTLTLFEADLLDGEETIRRLKTYVLANQFLFHTEKSLQYLSFVEIRSVGYA